MDTMSSRLEAAISNVLTPFISPYPKRLSRNRLGTSTAGLTADNVNLWNEIRQRMIIANMSVDSYAIFKNIT